MSELELKAEGGGRLVPALVLVYEFGPAKSEVEETLKPNLGQRYERTATKCNDLGLD